MSTLMTVNRQWQSRPDEERFTSLHALHALNTRNRELSISAAMSTRAIEFTPDESDAEHKGLLIKSRKSGKTVTPTHWAFSQIATRAGFPAEPLRSLPAALAADVLNYKLHTSSAEDVGTLIRRNAETGEAESMHAMTGSGYGRVYNADISEALTRMFGDGVSGDWRVPGEFGKPVPVTKENTTLYAGDRDMFVFLCDEQHRIELPGRRNGETGSLARGLIFWNSEVGSMSFGMAAFMFDYVCSNRIVWGVREYREQRFRHTISAPERLQSEALPLLKAYANSAASPVEAALIAAQNRKVEDVSAFLANRKYANSTIAAIAETHEREENRPMESAWDVVTGITAYAKSVPYQADRVKLEKDAGKILDLVAA